MKHNSSGTFASALLAIATTSALHAQTTLIDASFDGVANDTNGSFSLLTNAPASDGGATWDLQTGLIDRGTSANATASAVSDTTIDVTALGSDLLEITFEVESASSVTSNGIFFGLQTGLAGDNIGGNLWNNLGPTFGFSVRGTNGDTSVFTHDGATQLWQAFAPDADQDADPATPQDSFADGFTVTIIISSTEWFIAINGLLDVDGNPITGTSGTWSSIPNFDFSNFQTDMRVVASTQGTVQGTLDLASITVVQSPNQDSDGDLMPDAYETANNLDPNDATDAAIDNDSDGGPDGLTNLEEFNAGTNPQDSDSDNDGLLDGQEVNGTLNPYQTAVAGDASTTAPGLPTDPNESDSDMDGLSDFEELDNTNGSISNPNASDTDGDGLEDFYEVSNGLDPADATGANGAAGDLDSDLLTNLEEQTAGTDPNNDDTDGDTLTDGAEVQTHATNPLVTDSDGDNLDDAVEVNGGVTLPTNADTDFDEFLDSVEIAAGTDPNDAASFPTFPAISWSVEALDEETDLLTDGTLLYAENLNGPAATVNTIPFASAIDNEGTRATPNFLTQITNDAGAGNFYDDEVPALSPLLENTWTGGADRTVSIFGLTPGGSYAVQVGRADDRNSGTLVGRFMRFDGFGGEDTLEPVGPLNTIYGGSANPAIIFTGTFTATAAVQNFEIEQLLPGGGGASTVLNFIQVREVSPRVINISDIAVNGAPDSVTLTWDSTDTEVFVVNYSFDLIDWSGELDDSAAADAGSTTSKTFNLSDFGLAGEKKLFFRVQLQPAP